MPNALPAILLPGSSGRAAACREAVQGRYPELLLLPMPKLELPGAHHKFTDHNIRI